jgi:Ca-activated chloride channel family protein
MVIRRLPPAAAMLLLLLSPDLPAQSPVAIQTSFGNESTAPAPTLRVFSDLALIDVSVIDGNGKPLRGLPASSFHLFEHGAEQKIVSVSETDLPISAVIVFDESRSMGKGVRQCAGAVQKFLEDSTAGDEFALITFANQVVVESDFTNDARTIQTRLLTVKSQGRTALLDAVQSAALLMRHAHNQRRVILILTDGGDNRSRSRESEVLRMLLETEAQVYAVSIPQQKPLDDPYTAFGPELLDRLSDAAGGRNVGMDGFWAVDRAMRQINDQIRSEYVLAFKPENLSHDGKFRRVSLQLTKPSGVRQVSVSCRPGYYDALE